MGPSGLALAGATIVATGVVTVAGIRAPLTVAVIGLMLFGVLHNVLEIRHVLGTFSALLTPPVLGLVGILVLGIMAARVWGPSARLFEILLGYGVLAVGLGIGHRRNQPEPDLPERGAQREVGGRRHTRSGRWWRTLGWGLAIAAGLGLSLTHPALHVVALAHLHNLVPLAFLWWWAARLPRTGRRAFRAAQVAWVVVVPAIVLAGVTDRWIRPAPDLVAGFGPGVAAVARGVATPGADVVWGTRLLVVFAILQTMHYLVWVGFFPRFGSDAVARFEARWPSLTNRRVVVAAVAVALVFAVVFWADYAQGRAWYAVLATFHAYLEFPILLAMLVGVAQRKSDPDTINTATPTVDASRLSRRDDATPPLPTRRRIA